MPCPEILHTFTLVHIYGQRSGRPPTQYLRREGLFLTVRRMNLLPYFVRAALRNRGYFVQLVLRLIVR